MVLLVGLAIAASSLMPGSTKQDLLKFELGDFYLLFATEIGGIEGIKWGNPEFFQFNASEVAHFILFFFLGLGVFLTQQNFSRGMQFFSLLIFGAGLEFLQHFYCWSCAFGRRLGIRCGRSCLRIYNHIYNAPSV